MAKQGMKRPNVTHTKQRNEQAAVPEIQGKAKHSNEKANPVIAGTKAPGQKVYHQKKPTPEAYTDLAKDNEENDLSYADSQELK